MRAAWIGGLACSLGCAQLLSYDDYRERGASGLDASTGELEAAVADTSVTDGGPPPARPPGRPPGAATPSGTGKTLWLAVKRYSYGAAPPSGGGTPSAWASNGYDLDGVCTTERDSVANVDTCLRPAGAKQDSLIDGERCRDNNFGRNIATLLSALGDAEKTLNDLVASGSTTWILRIEDVDPSADDAYAPGALFRSSDDRAATVPVWDGSDDRAVQSDSLLSGDLAKPVLSFPKGFIAGGTWVSGDPQALSVVAPLTSVGFFPLDLEHAFVTLELDAARATGANGLLVGVLSAPRVKGAIDEVADFMRVCPGTTLYADTLQRFTTALDVVVGAPGLLDVTRTCDGLSAAIGFQVTSIKPVTRVVPPLAPRKPRCGDAG